MLLLLCLVSLFTLFSVPVSAVSIDLEGYNIYVVSEAIFDNGKMSLGSLTFTPNDGTQTVFTDDLPTSVYQSSLLQPIYIDTTYYIGMNNDTNIFEGNHFQFKMQNAYDTTGWVSIMGGPVRYVDPVDTIFSAVIYYVDGSVTYANVNDDKRTNGAYDLFFNVDTNKAVTKVSINIKQEFNPTTFNDIFTNVGDQYNFVIQRTLGEVLSDDSYQISIKYASEEEEKLDKIDNTLTSGFQRLWESITGGFSELIDSILELPSKLWDLISEGLKALFVPSDEFVTEFIGNSGGFIEQKLGFVYQGVFMLEELWSNVMDWSSTSRVEFPAVTIPLPDNQSFTFGGYDVKIIPDGFDYIKLICQTMSGLVCTVLFVNGLRKRYDEFMGG